MITPEVQLKDMHLVHVVGAQSLGAHGNNQARPCSSHVFSTGSKGTKAMQKPGNNAKAFRLSSQVVHK
jgi:hypothetical protein